MCQVALKLVLVSGPSTTVLQFVYPQGSVPLCVPYLGLAFPRRPGLSFLLDAQHFQRGSVDTRLFQQRCFPKLRLFPTDTNFLPLKKARGLVLRIPATTVPTFSGAPLLVLSPNSSWCRLGEVSPSRSTLPEMAHRLCCIQWGLSTARIWYR